jgi:hypothetical protein
MRQKRQGMLGLIDTDLVAPDDRAASGMGAARLLKPTTFAEE